MYTFSLDFYIRCFIQSIKLAEKPQQKNLKHRIEFIIKSLNQ